MGSKKVYMNREISWLKFNERVLEEAENAQVPLLERLSFVSIFQSNLDEFFMVRVGSLQDQMLLDKDLRDSKTNMTAKEQIDEIIKRSRKLNKRKDAIYNELMAEIEKYGIKMVDFSSIDEKDSQYLKVYFELEIGPLISPMIVGKRQPFPFMKDKDIYAVVALETKNGKEKMGIIPCNTGMFKRLIELPAHPGKFILSEELILHFVADIFKGYKVKSKSLLRLTRNADIDSDALYDEDLDYRDFMAELVKKRKKLAPVRVELSRDIDRTIVDMLCEYLELDEDRIFKNGSPLDVSFLFSFQDILRKETGLFYEKRIPQMPAWYNSGQPVMEQVEEADRLLSYPFESIKPFLNMLHEAAHSPEVMSIKMTLYRVAKQSKVVEALVEAAENGKEVVVLVELRARFDEENNIGWSRTLEDAGCQVIYGLDGLKVHSKLCLITRKNDEGVSYITQIGTGNYNEKTAKLYTDLSIMTSDKSIGVEATKVFKALLKGETVKRTDKLLVAPNCLQNKILNKIDKEIENVKAGKEGYIGAKLNSLTDKKIINKLIEASKAGVKIQLIIRGICCIIPGVEGETDNIEVISIVGRFLEHSRIYIFGNGTDRQVYIASADFMTRNTVRRVEVAAPILDKDIKKRLVDMFNLMLTDNVKARHMDSEGNYTIPKNDDTEQINVQEILYQQAYDAK